MGSFSIWHIAIVAVVALILFGGKGKLSGIMGDAAKGIKAFKDGLKDEPDSKDTTVAASEKKDENKAA
ncbi:MULTISPECIES: twin-arginine translocase TatA/TatE family subunit [Asticcacaulis]|jgi:sec-independent protein translocase protein TatA|uniref:Sec-independent protein translocase protein TatA n=2 Tax=Asticcacaulis TaxID=76890 RepID=A0A918UV97_9CAUL|nr:MULTISPECIES: twin-arginine translocase TatA/TatE family subunit [Asticcacaulis]MDC7675025.1 twin-arginine translocase TatA/TatE family subunit [Asticcacaulis machinosus]WAC49077.1 twin-arginine translocase TatA/TatE family subunit [Asticcacaulis sp. SL142]WKL56866.1 twin-arginine translocase TatA/TatE family subunit [Asticcacaulis sp. ZE23SCel15]GGZ36632.1 hypothetical protein GCM10011273_23720 [Asticcacaulis endophyticus]